MVDHAHVRASDQHRAEAMTSRAGYAQGGRMHSDVKESDLHQDRATANAAVHAHERHDHKGEELTKLPRRRGGRTMMAVGPAPKPSNGKRARGGKSPVTLIVHNQPFAPAEKQAAMQKGATQGMRLGAALGARQAARRMAAPPPRGLAPGMPTAPGGAAPMMPSRPGMMPTMPPGGGGMPPGGGMMAGGGRVKVREHTRRRAGGKL